ncbi:hypothetical protein LJR189_001977 [Acidovorax delafieldii]|uniref:hypothetical protein n=1 Tax=Acidovorax delafieldii TaxID=47920 RepID=UPI003ECD8085
MAEQNIQPGLQTPHGYATNHSKSSHKLAFKHGNCAQIRFIQKQAYFLQLYIKLNIIAQNLSKI